MKNNYKKNISFAFIICLVLLCIISPRNVNNTFAYAESNVEINTAKSNIREDWWWTSTELITDYSTAQSYSPSIVVDSMGNVHVVWGEQDYHFRIDCYHRIKRPDGTWGEIIRATWYNLCVAPSDFLLIDDVPCILIMDLRYYNEDYYYEIYYAYRGRSGWLGGRECISNSPSVSSMHPRAAALGRYLCTFWTEGNNVPYDLLFDKRIPRPVLPVSFVSVN